MSLTYWMTWLEAHPVLAGATALAITLFLWIYILTRRAWRHEQEALLSRLGESLSLFTAAAGPLRHAASSKRETPEALKLLSERLEALRAAPHLPDDLHLQITGYLDDPDATRLPQLQRTLSREIGRLSEEHTKLVASYEQPGWGLSLWLQLRPLLPPAMLAAGIVLSAWLVQALMALPESSGSAEVWTLLCIVSRYVSGVFSLMLIGAVLSKKRKEKSPALKQFLTALIPLLFLLQLLGLEASPYVLVLQLILYSLGFDWVRRKRRKNRPFPGHYDLSETSTSAPGVSELIERTEP